MGSLDMHVLLMGIYRHGSCFPSSMIFLPFQVLIAMALYSAIVMLMRVNEFQAQRHSCTLAVQFLGYQLLQITGMFVSYFPAELCFFFLSQ